MWLWSERGVLPGLRRPELSRQGFPGLGGGWEDREKEVREDKKEKVPHILSTNTRAAKDPLLPYYQLTV